MDSSGVSAMGALTLGPKDAAPVNPIPPQQNPRPKAAFVILSQATPERVVYLKSTLYFLFRRFNARPDARYPVRVLHEGDFDERLQAEIRAGLRGDCGDLLSFVRLDPGDFDVPTWIDRARLDRNIAAQPVPYWRDLRYRLMCRFWLAHAHKYVDDLDHYCRLDDDAWIEDDVPGDFIAAAAAAGAVLAGAIVHVDCPICTHGMRGLFRSLGLATDANDARLFVRAPLSRQFLEGIDAVPEYDGAGAMVAHMPVNLFNNFSVNDVAFWRRPDVRAVLRAIDATGNVFYYRWGDAPIITLIASTLGTVAVPGPFGGSGGMQLLRVRYSKRLQRQAFIDGAGLAHRYMPATYAEDSSAVVIA